MEARSERRRAQNSERKSEQKPEWKPERAPEQKSERKPERKLERKPTSGSLPVDPAPRIQLRRRSLGVSQFGLPHPQRVDIVALPQDWKGFGGVGGTWFPWVGGRRVWIQGEGGPTRAAEGGTTRRPRSW